MQRKVFCEKKVNYSQNVSTMYNLDWQNYFMVHQFFLCKFLKRGLDIRIRLISSMFDDPMFLREILQQR